MTVEELMRTPIELWDVSSVIDMSLMFESASSFNQDLSKWDTPNVTTMRFMFYNATSFNKDISNWGVSSVKEMRYMFKDAKSFNQDLEAWGPRLRPDIDVEGMFEGSGLEGNEPSWYHEIMSRV